MQTDAAGYMTRAEKPNNDSHHSRKKRAEGAPIQRPKRCLSEKFGVERSTYIGGLLLQHHVPLMQSVLQRAATLRTPASS